MASILRRETVDIIFQELNKDIKDSCEFERAVRDCMDVMVLICDYVERHGNIALSVGSEWMYQDDKAQVDALQLVGRILDTLMVFSEEEPV